MGFNKRKMEDRRRKAAEQEAALAEFGGLGMILQYPPRYARQLEPSEEVTVPGGH